MRARHFFGQRHRLVLGIAATAVLVGVPIAAAAGSTQSGTLAKSRAVMTAAAEAVGPMPADLAQYWAKRPAHFAHPSPEPTFKVQPNGQGFLARVIPYELGGGVETVDGYGAVKGKDGWWRYAVRGKDGRLHATKQLITRDKPTIKSGKARLPQVIWTSQKDLPQMKAKLERYLRTKYRTMALKAKQAGVPVTFKVPAMLFTVNQEEFQPDSTPAKFEAQLSGEGTSPTGTVTEMYKEQSFGNMIVDIDVFGPYDSVLSLAHNCWYGTDGGPILGELLGLGGYGSRGMALEATPQADPFVNFGLYDNDNNGFVDFLLMIHSGPGAEQTGDPCDVWSHYFGGLGEPIPTSDLNAEGEPVRIGPVMTVPEINSAIGVNAHELMHALGEPDYYDTTSATAGTGDWDLGAGGSWNGIPAQTNPVHFNPLMKVNFEWVEPRIVTATQLGVQLRPRASYPDLVMVPVYTAPVGHADNAQCNKAPIAGVPGQNNAFYLPDGSCAVEGFLLENVSRVSAFSDSKACKFVPADFDRAIYASGLAVWHWDFRSYAGSNNTNPLRYMLDIEEFDRRDARQDLQNSANLTRGEPTDLFWGDPVGMTGATQNTANGTERQLGPVGTRDNNGVQTGWAFTNIRPNDYAGLAHAAEKPGAVITLDLVKHDATTVDVSGDFVRVVQPTPAPILDGASLNMQTVVYNHGGQPTEANVSIYGANPSKNAPFFTQTVSLAGFERKVIDFTYTPRKRGLNSMWVAAKAPGDVTPGNDMVRTDVTTQRKGAADVLIVDNDRHMTQEEGFEALLQGLGVGYHVVEGEPTAATMAPYKGVIWLTTPVSGSTGVISAAARTALTGYLDGGGKVWFSSSRAMGYLGITQGQGSFLATYFGLTALGNTTDSAGTMTGLGDAEIGGTREIEVGHMDQKPYLDFGNLAAPGAVGGTATALFKHSLKPANIVGTKVVGTSGFRTVYTPPLYIVSDATERLTLGREVLTFFGIGLGKVKPDRAAIKHERFRHVQVGEDVPFTVGAVVNKGSIAKVEIVYRSFGRKTWKTVTLASVGDGLYGGAIPGSDVHNNGLEYYAQATTDTGKKVQSENNASLPNVATAPYGDPDPGPYGSCGG